MGGRAALQWVPFGEGFQIPAGFEYSGSGPFEWAVWIHVVDGIAQPLAVRCWSPAGRPLTAESFRRLPLGRLVREGVLLSSRPREEFPKSYVQWDSIEEAEQKHAEVAKAYTTTKRSPRDRGPVTDELLQRVADIYRDELASGAPTRKVAEKLNYSRASAGRLVMEARRRGFLPQTEPRRARG
jgi:hypothetical protein